MCGDFECLKCLRVMLTDEAVNDTSEDWNGTDPPEPAVASPIRRKPWNKVR